MERHGRAAAERAPASSTRDERYVELREWLKAEWRKDARDPERRGDLRRARARPRAARGGTCSSPSASSRSWPSPSSRAPPAGTYHSGMRMAQEAEAELTQTASPFDRSDRIPELSGRTVENDDAGRSWPAEANSPAELRCARPTRAGPGTELRQDGRRPPAALSRAGERAAAARRRCSHAAPSSATSTRASRAAFRSCRRLRTKGHRSISKTFPPARGITRDGHGKGPEYTFPMTVLESAERHQELDRRADRGRRCLQPGRRPRPARRAPSRSPRPRTRASSAARARTSSTTRGAPRRSAPSSTSTSRRSPPRCCTTSSRTPAPTSRRCAAEFGDEIAQLVEGVTKLTRIQFQSREQAEAENYRKMIVAMAQDVRVILIKLADRLHNMRTIEYLGKQKQVQKAQGDARGLRAARAPARHPHAQVGARGPRLRDAAPAQVRGDQGDGQPSAAPTARSTCARRR